MYTQQRVMWNMFQRQTNIDAYEVQLKDERDKRAQAQTKLSQTKVGYAYHNYQHFVSFLRILRNKKA